MNEPRRMRRTARALAPLLLFCGCAAVEPIFVPLATPLLWPSPPEPPRFRWLGEIRGESDLERPRSFWEGVTALVSGEAESAAFRSAHGIALSPAGVLWVTDPAASTVHRLDLESREYRAITLAEKDRPFVSPIGITLLPRDGGDASLLIADRALGAVFVLSPEGDPQGVLDSSSLAAPVGVAVSSSGRVHVVDVVSHDVKVFSPDGELERAFGGRGREPGRLNYPTHVACGPGGKVWVSDSLNSRVQVFDEEGTHVETIGSRGRAPGSFSQPKGIALDSHGRLYVVDSHFENVQVFAPTGELLLALGREGSGAGELWLPVGAFVDHLDRLWVADSANARVQVFEPVGAEGVE